MSNTSNEYTCQACTLIQSIKRPACELCEAPNPYFADEIFKKDEAIAAALANGRRGDGTKTCTHCGYINVGYDIQTCISCQKALINPMAMFARIFQGRNNDNEVIDSDNDDDDVIVTENSEQTQTKVNEKESKKADAVEKPMNEEELHQFYNEYILLMKDQKQRKHSFTHEKLCDILHNLFNSLQYKSDQSDGQLTFTTCQICLDETSPMVTMKTCGHKVVCVNDFNRYLSLRIRDDEILPWIPCPAELCSIPCHADNITQDGGLNYDELLTFLTTYMLKKLSRNENFVTCSQCEKGGFLQIGSPRKEKVTCQICNQKQTIEKGVDGDLDIEFKQMIKSGQLRECPTCRHLTLKEKGLCNIIQCAKCGIWWNWRTKEQGHNEKDMKQRARNNGTLWEPGELRFQQDLERRDPAAFKALLERNGIKYNPNYLRGGWNDQ